MQVVEIGRGAQYWVDGDGIVHGRETRDAPFERRDAVEALDVIGQLAGGSRRALLMDITKLRSMSREARAFFSEPARADVLLAVALQIGSPLSRAIGNIFLGLNRPAVPIKLFNDEGSALEWLRGFTGGAPSRAGR